MRRGGLQRLLRRAARRYVARKAITVTVVVFFCFQFVRFYLVAPLDFLACFGPNFRPGVSAVSDHVHDHANVGVHSHSKDEGYTLQHCKDTYEGIGLTPGQPLGLPVTVSWESLGPSLTASLCEPCQPLDHFLPPPFQPPRHQS